MPIRGLVNLLAGSHIGLILDYSPFYMVSTVWNLIDRTDTLDFGGYHKLIRAFPSPIRLNGMPWSASRNQPPVAHPPRFYSATVVLQVGVTRNAKVAVIDL